MNPIDIVIIGTTGLAKDQHPMGPEPISPIEHSFKDASKFQEALEKYYATSKEWNTIAATLKTYQISSMVCDSGITVRNDVLHWHLGKKYKANILENGTLQVI